MTDVFLTVAEAESQGVDMANVRLCKELRKLAKLNRLKIDMTEHRSGLNKHLFSYIEYCGLRVEDYVRGYMSNLQPYMIERFSSQEADRNFICVLDKMYRISVYLKVDKTFGNEIVVSFHENNKRGIAKENNMLQFPSEGNVPVFAEEVVARVGNSEREEIKILMQRGMLTVPITLMGSRCEDGVYIVDRRTLETPIIDYCNQYIRDLYTSDIDLDALDKVELFSVLHQISFTSYGNSVFSNLSLLIDNMAIQKSQVGKMAADFVLTTYAQHLELNEAQRYELVELLDERYKVSSQKDISLITQRIKDCLFLDSVDLAESNGQQLKLEIKERE